MTLTMTDRNFFDFIGYENGYGAILIEKVLSQNDLAPHLPFQIKSGSSRCLYGFRTSSVGRYGVISQNITDV